MMPVVVDGNPAAVRRTAWRTLLSKGWTRSERSTES
jgi:hypothetical protein